MSSPGRRISIFFFFSEPVSWFPVTLSWETLGRRQRWRIPDRLAQAVLLKHCSHSMRRANVFDPSFPKEVLPGARRWMNQHVYKVSSSVTPFSFLPLFILCSLSSLWRQSLAELSIVSGDLSWSDNMALNRPKIGNKCLARMYHAEIRILLVWDYSSENHLDIFIFIQPLLKSDMNSVTVSTSLHLLFLLHQRQLHYYFSDTDLAYDALRSPVYS